MPGTSSRVIGPTVAVALLAVVPPAARAATITVCPVGCDFTTIQAAVNAAAPGDTVEVGAGTYAENVTIAKDLTVRGAGSADTTVDGGAAGTVFTIDGAVVALRDMTIRNGSTAGDGGGVRSTGPAARLLLDGCVVRDNTAAGRGGGIFSGDGEAVITTDEITGNSASDFGGGIYNDGGLLTVRGSAIHANSAVSFGGGISTYGSLTLENSTVSGNTAQQAGGIDVVSLTVEREVRITTTTITQNTASLGGGLFDYYGDGGAISFGHTIVANNAGGNCARSPSSTSPLVSRGHNLESGSSCLFVDPTDLRNTNPLLGALADNGGPTPTHAPAPGSPAVDAGAVWCGPVDQRAEGRAVDGDLDGDPRCDIGALERSCTGGAYLPDGRYGRLVFAPRCTETAAGLPGPAGSPHAWSAVTLPVHRGPRERLLLVAAPATEFGRPIGDDEILVNGQPAGLGPGEPQPGRPPWDLGVPIRNNLVPRPVADVTALIAPGSGSVTFELVDTDREILGSTAIYLVQDCGVTIDRPGGRTEIHFHSLDDTEARRASGFKVVSGSLNELRATGGFTLASCLGIFSRSPGVDFFEDPPPGDGRYYVASGTTSCLDQGYGDSSLDPDPRDFLDGAGVCP